MSGNTRGKLKEHFEGIHRNMDWCIHHVNQSLQLITTQLSFTEDFVKVQGDKEATDKLLMENPMYQGIKGLGEGIQTLDEIAQKIYATF